MSAQEPADLAKLKSLSLEQIMEIEIPTVYGASKHLQKITDAPSSVTIVTRDEIRSYGHRTLADILRSVRDFHVTNDRSSYYVGVRGFNRPGDYGGRILFLVDGHRINEVARDSADAGMRFPVDVDMMERVEVIRGPGSVLYGTNAFFAVINVITRKGADLNGLEASVEAGSFDSYQARLSYGKVFENGLSLTLTGSLYDSGGDDLHIAEFDDGRANDGMAIGRHRDHVAKAGATIRYKHFTLQGNYVKASRGVPTAPYGSLFNEDFTVADERATTRLTYERAFDNGWEVRGGLYWDYYCNQVDFSKPNYFAPAPERVTFRDRTEAEWWGGDLEVSKRLLTSHRVTLGMNYRDTAKLSFRSEDLDPALLYFATQTSSTTVGVFVQDEWAINRKLTLNAGLSYDWFDTFGSRITPRGALIFKPREQTVFKLIYGEAFRSPTVFESQYEIPAGAAGRSLDPEEIETFELVLEQSITRRARLSASIFHNEITNLISLTTDATGSRYFYENRGDARTTGGSVELEAELPAGIKGRASYTIQRTTDAETGTPLSNSPEHLAKLNLLVPLYREKVWSGLELQYVSETENARREVVDGYFLANLTLYGREIVPGLDASLSVYNLFDTDYAYAAGPEHRQPAIKQDGRAFRLKFTYRF